MNQHMNLDIRHYSNSILKQHPETQLDTYHFSNPQSDRMFSLNNMDNSACIFPSASKTSSCAHNNLDVHTTSNAQNTLGLLNSSNSSVMSVSNTTSNAQNEEWQSQFFRTKLCPYNISGRCINGQRCRFAHSLDELRPLPDLHRTKLCESYVKREPCNQSDCPFAHNPCELRTSSHSFYKVTLCNFYKKGRCWNGIHCRFAHGPSELQAVPDTSQLLPEQIISSMDSTSARRTPSTSSLSSLNEQSEFRSKHTLSKIVHSANLYTNDNQQNVRITDTHPNLVVHNKNTNHNNNPKNVQQRHSISVHNSGYNNFLTDQHDLYTQSKNMYSSRRSDALVKHSGLDSGPSKPHHYHHSISQPKGNRNLFDVKNYALNCTNISSSNKEHSEHLHEDHSYLISAHANKSLIETIPNHSSTTEGLYNRDQLGIPFSPPSSIVNSAPLLKYNHQGNSMMSTLSTASSGVYSSRDDHVKSNSVSSTQKQNLLRFIQSPTQHSLSIPAPNLGKYSKNVNGMYNGALLNDHLSSPNSIMRKRHSSSGVTSNINDEVRGAALDVTPLLIHSSRYSSPLMTLPENSLSSQKLSTPVLEKTSSLSHTAAHTDTVSTASACAGSSLFSPDSCSNGLYTMSSGVGTPLMKPEGYELLGVSPSPTFIPFQKSRIESPEMHESRNHRLSLDCGKGIFSDSSKLLPLGPHSSSFDSTMNIKESSIVSSTTLTESTPIGTYWMSSAIEHFQDDQNKSELDLNLFSKGLFRELNDVNETFPDEPLMQQCLNKNIDSLNDLIEATKSTLTQNKDKDTSITFEYNDAQGMTRSSHNDQKSANPSELSYSYLPSITSLMKNLSMVSSSMNGKENIDLSKHFSSPDAELNTLTAYKEGSHLLCSETRGENCVVDTTHEVPDQIISNEQQQPYRHSKLSEAADFCKPVVDFNSLLNNQVKSSEKYLSISCFPQCDDFKSLMALHSTSPLCPKTLCGT